MLAAEAPHCMVHQLHRPAAAPLLLPQTACADLEHSKLQDAAAAAVAVHAFHSHAPADHPLAAVAVVAAVQGPVLLLLLLVAVLAMLASG